jgi:methionine biosynthesis protein MetW
MTRRTLDVDYHWKKSDGTKLVEKFDHLREFLPRDFNTVLDVGGGMGDFHTSLSRWKKHEYTLVDFSPFAVQSVKDKNLNAIEADVDSDTLPFPDNSFDLVVATDVLEHFRNPWAVLREMSRVSKKYIFIYSPNFASLACRLDLVRGRPIRQMVMDKHGSVYDASGRHVDHIYFLTYANVMHWAGRLNLKILNSRVYWYRRYSPFRWVLEAFFKNWGDVFEVVFVKQGSKSIEDDPNFHFHV